MVKISVSDYYRWKDGKKVYKAPWIKKYWENITDENQYKLGKICEGRLVFIMSLTCFAFGIWFGFLLWG